MKVVPRLFAIGCRAVCFVAVTIWILPNLAAAEEDALTTILQPVFRQSCVKCHGEHGKPSGKVNLFELRSAADLTKNPELVRDLVKVLDSGVMPPGGRAATGSGEA